MSLILVTCRHPNNWGDRIGPILANAISGLPIKEVSKTYKPKSPAENVYMTVGSILSWATKDMIVWGAGFIAANRQVISAPKKICAVRGPLTRALLLDKGIECPEIYGDPALLYPRFFNPKIKKRFDVGVIPHYVDVSHPWIKKIRKSKHVHVINICDKPKKFIRELKSCDVIISSSLHGMIAADAYGIPSIWVDFTCKVIGGGFKFNDYFESVGRKAAEPIKVDVGTKLSDILKTKQEYDININLNKLMAACPFK